MSYLDELNDEQCDAVKYCEGPLLILAGAGSGKTRVLTYKIAHLLQQNYARPSEIFAVTFTNKAAGEMKERILKLMPGLYFPSMGTFHSLCARFLRDHIEGDGQSSRFVIYDSGDCRILIRECLKELNLDDKVFTPERMSSAISKLKNKLLDPESFARTGISYESRITYDVYCLYEEKLKSNNALDFDDLLMKSVFLLRKNKELLDRYSRMYKYVLIDEYQDINFAQYELILLLSSFHKKITVVGDDDQSIYRFRGAEMSLLMRFEEDFPEARVIKLERNYRSTQVILEAANNLMKQNRVRREKNLWTEREGGEKIGYFRAATGRSEARFVILKIRELMRNDNYNYRDFAILYRTNAQSRLFEEVLIQEGMPYNLIGSLKYYERKEIKDLLAYLRVVVNRQDSLSLRRIINVPPRGVGDVTMKKLEFLSREEHIDLLEAAGRLSSSHEGTAKMRAQLAHLVEVLEEAARSLTVKTAGAVVEDIIDALQYREYLTSSGTAEGVAREENINELITVVKEFESFSADASLEAFLAHISLISDIDLWEESEGRINLMTFHLTKGLEFPVVFITGLEEKLIPHIMSRESEEDLEEERRLCYVGITRARDRLFITHAEERFLRGITERRDASRFLAEIPESLLTLYGGTALPSASSHAMQWKTERVEICDDQTRGFESLKRGDQVTHQFFGVGKVLTVVGDTVKVDFVEKGIKRVVRDYLSKSIGAHALRKISFQKGDRVFHPKWRSGVVCRCDEESSLVMVIFTGTGTQFVQAEELSPLPSPQDKRPPL
ncbi:MAG: ATP-dependent helicase [Vulcanimicrobiota bacterium]